jgi:hypothetical protein
MSGRHLRSLTFVAFLIGIGVLSLADRAPSATKAALGVGQRAGSFGERAIGLDLIDRGDVPFAFDTVGHLVLWAGAGILAYAAFGGRASASFIVISLITVSGGVELGQGWLSSTRRPELTDLIANGIGVVIGVVGASILWGGISLFGRLTRSLNE